MKFIANYLIRICLTIIFLSGCEDLTDPGKFVKKNSLIFVLKSGDKKQKLYLYRNLNISEEIPGYPFGNYDEYFREGADIYIFDGKNSFNDFAVEKFTGDFFNFINSKYYTNNKEIKFFPSTNYNLIIEVDGQKITGNATTPGPFEIENYNYRDTLFVNTNKNYESIEINWTKSENAKYYTVEMHKAKTDSIFINGELTIINYNFDYPPSASETIFNSTNYKINVPIDVDSVKIDITAYDENSYKHFYLGHDEVGVTNAHGVFGAAVVNSIILIIKK